jgi:uncharacterized protein YajQ (UPF0234 family)
MPTFDIVSDVDKHELSNAVDQANRELETRFDFRGVDARFELDGLDIKQTAPSDFQLEQMLAILHARFAARGLDIRSLEVGDVESNIAQARRTITCKKGLDKAAAKKVINEIKAAKIKVTTQINEDKVRVTGKKRDDLQEVMALLRKAEMDLPLQFENFRD